jgi:hypothetical protein
VPAGATLTIQPGTVVFGQSLASIIVRGRINATGTEAQPIIFRAAGCENRWGGIGIDNTGTSAASPTQVLAYCDFEFGDTPAGYAGNIAPVGSKMLIDHCKFKFVTANAVDGTDARVEVRDSFFESIHEGVHCTRSTVLIFDSHFLNIVGDKDCIDFDFNGAEESRIERNLFENSSDDGIDLAQTTVHIRDNIFFNIQDKALSLEGNGPLGPPIVTGNVIINSGSAITLKDGVNVMEGHHNTVVGNQEGIKLQAKATSQGGHGVFHSMILYNNIKDVDLDAASSISFSYTDISEALWPGVGNISGDPLFSNVFLRDYSLRPGSPCIDSGQGGSDMGAIPFTGGTPMFVRGDSSGDQSVNLPDVMRTLNYLFQNGSAPSCLDSMDANDDGFLDVSDPMYTLFYLYADGAEPPLPFPGSGPDPTADTIPCL